MTRQLLHAIAVPSRPARRATAWLALSLLLLLAAAAAPASAGAHGAPRVQRLCGLPRPGAATCTALKLLTSPLSAAQLHANAVRLAALTRAGIHAAPGSGSPISGYLTPQSLHAAYGLPSESSSPQTIAVVDAYDDPSAEADLGVYDKQFGLPACTTANGCFRKLNEWGQSSPLPPTEGGWAGEISIDVQMAHAICENCHVLLMEASSEEFSDLGTAVNSAVTAGADEISNSYAGPEEASYSSYATSYYRHPGSVITAASGDCGYLNDACGWLAAANFPADSPDVVGVGGTKLTQTKGGWRSSTWRDAGSGCSTLFAAPPWQSALASFTATGCASGRAVSDISAIADPNSGVDIYDSTPEGKGDPTGWGVWGGTSVASPIVAAEFALAGGSHAVAYPAETLYSHSQEAGAFYDIVSGANGNCAGASICSAATGYDGPTGLGSPIGMRAFAAPASPANLTPPSISGIPEQGQTLQETQGHWSNSPSSLLDQWQKCNAAGNACTAIAGASGQSLLLGLSDVGSTIRVQETAANADGVSAPSVSAPSPVILSDVPTITSFTPASGITGSWVTITGSALQGVTEVHFASLNATIRTPSMTQIEALVPSGVLAGRISVSTPLASAKSAAKFTPSLSLSGFSPQSGPAGTLVKIKGVGFTASSSVSFDGVPASVHYVSPTKLTALAPAGAGSGPITLTNTQAPAGSVQSAGAYSFG